MAIRQVVNLRAPAACIFGDRDQQAAYEQEVGRAREAQRVPFAVAPRQAVTLHDGRVRRAGDEIRAQDFEHTAEAGPGWRQLEKLVARGIVIESLRGPSGPEAA